MMSAIFSHFLPPPPICQKFLGVMSAIFIYFWPPPSPSGLTSYVNAPLYISKSICRCWSRFSTCDLFCWCRNLTEGYLVLDQHISYTYRVLRTSLFCAGDCITSVCVAFDDSSNIEGPLSLMLVFFELLLTFHTARAETSFYLIPCYSDLPKSCWEWSKHGIFNHCYVFFYGEFNGGIFMVTRLDLDMTLKVLVSILDLEMTLIMAIVRYVG